MFDTFKKSIVYAIFLIISGILIFFFQLILSHSFSLLGVITFLIGLGLLNLIKASKAELNILRLENIELRKED